MLSININGLSRKFNAAEFDLEWPFPASQPLNAIDCLAHYCADTSFLLEGVRDIKIVKHSEFVDMCVISLFAPLRMSQSTHDIFSDGSDPTQGFGFYGFS